MDKIREIHIEGRRWFQKSYGNTYNTVEIWINGQVEASLRKSYGYGDHYIQRAQESLESNEKLPGLQKYKNGSTEPLWAYCRRNDIILNTRVTDVAREKNLTHQPGPQGPMRREENDYYRYYQNRKNED